MQKSPSLRCALMRLDRGVMMLIAIVVLVWLGVALVALALCHAAALGDRVQGPGAPH